ncbi:L-amino-acid oxidase [Plecturocebus cupreus]
MSPKEPLPIFQPSQYLFPTQLHGGGGPVRSCPPHRFLGLSSRRLPRCCCYCGSSCRLRPPHGPAFTTAFPWPRRSQRLNKGRMGQFKHRHRCSGPCRPRLPSPCMYLTPASQSQPCILRLLVLVSILLSLAASLDWKTQCSQDPSEKCMHDPDYKQLLKVVTLGLDRTLKPQRVIVVGTGVAGLLAAKVLSDAGHKVTILEADNRIRGCIFIYWNWNIGWIGQLGAMCMPSSHRILHKLCQGLGLNLTKFTHTWTEVHEVVEKLPEKLGYALRPQEKGHSPEDIYQMALNQALKDLKALGCRKAMKKFERHALGIPPRGGEPEPACRAPSGR